MSPYVGMGNNSVNAADPNGDIPIYIIPNISFNKGGINIGIEFGIGVPGVSSLSVTGGISLGRDGGVQPYWSVQAGLGGGYAGYGSGGSFGGLGPFGWTQGGGWSVNVFSIGTQGGGASASFGLSYGQNGWDWSASARYTHQGNLDLSRPARGKVEESLDAEPEPKSEPPDPNLLACVDCKYKPATTKEEFIAQVRASEEIVESISTLKGYSDALLEKITDFVDTDGDGFISPSELIGGTAAKTAVLTFKAMAKMFVVGGVKNGGKTIFIKGVGKVNKNLFHREIKDNILKAANRNNFSRVVGSNPDVFVQKNTIYLKGAKNSPFRGKTYQTTLKASDFFK